VHQSPIKTANNSPPRSGAPSAGSGATSRSSPSRCTRQRTHRRGASERAPGRRGRGGTPSFKMQWYATGSVQTNVSRPTPSMERRHPGRARPRELAEDPRGEQQLHAAAECRERGEPDLELARVRPPELEVAARRVGLKNPGDDPHREGDQRTGDDDAREPQRRARVRGGRWSSDGVDEAIQTKVRETSPGPRLARSPGRTYIY
jgi:hypothetical protein